MNPPPTDDHASGAAPFSGGFVPHGLLPHHLLSATMLRLTRVRFAAWKNWQMRWFIGRYGVDMSEAVQPDFSAYPHFNAFFTRELRADARPMPEDRDALLSPADGMVSEAGRIEANTLLQAKGCNYEVETLLGGAVSGADFSAGSFFTVYLSPRDYHRVHMPLSGILTAMRYVPGRLFSVNASTVTRVPGLFTRNERVVSLFATPEHGLLAVVLVGAMFVGCMEQTWCGVVTPPRGRAVVHSDYPTSGGQAVRLERGQEMGRFNMGSTVIVLSERPVRWASKAGDPVRVRSLAGRFD